MTKLEKLKAKIVEALRDSGLEVGIALGYEITLEDVLIATRKKHLSLYIRDDGTFFIWEKFTKGGSGHHGVNSTYKGWIFSKSLDQQIPETIDFLYKLLK